MTNVYAWPPFSITGWELAEVYPQSRSVGLIEGRSRTSAAQRPRRNATAIVQGIGQDESGAGYVRMLERQWAGAPKLVRVGCLQSLWFLSRRGLDLSTEIIEWADNGEELVWTVNGDDLVWGDGDWDLQGAPVADGPWASLRVEGLPPSRIVARPSEVIKVFGSSAIESAYVMTVARSDADGVATIRTDRATAFTQTGLVSIGEAESIVFEAQGTPRAVQGMSGNFSFTWDFREVFEDEYPGGWTEIDPWR